MDGLEEAIDRIVGLKWIKRNEELWKYVRIDMQKQSV